MDVLITGETGFIGGHMKQYLECKKNKVTGYSRRNGFNLLNKEQLTKIVKGNELIYHFAAHVDIGGSVLNPQKTIEDNMKTTINVLEVCRKFDISLVFPSSGSIYGDSLVPLTEYDLLNPYNPYSASKTSLDRICYAYQKCYGLDVKIVRLFNPYGPNQKQSFVVPYFCTQALSNQPITVFGDGNDTRDFVYISDVIRGFWEVRNLDGGEVVNLASNIATTTRTLAQTIINETQSKSKVVSINYPEHYGGIRHQVGSNEKAKKLINWVPKVNLKEGIRQTITWIKNMRNRTYPVY
jgi:UDP-glucose 4-epimerase